MLERLLRQMGRPPLQKEMGQEAMTVPEWSPPVNISETAEAYVIEVELPSVKREDMHVLAQEGTLTIQGERRLEKDEGRKFHRVERVYGRFARSFTLPPQVDPGHISAEYRNGVLWLSLPKVAQEKPRAVEIAVG